MSSVGPTRLCRDAEESRRHLPQGDSAGGAVAPRVRAVEFVRRMRGASQPWLVRCEGGDNYVVKFQNNPQHARVLANEMLASRLGQRLGLPVAAPAFVEVSRSLLGSDPQLAFEVGERREPIRPGTHFGSRFPAIPVKRWWRIFFPIACCGALRT